MRKNTILTKFCTPEIPGLAPGLGHWRKRLGSQDSGSWDCNL